MSILQVRDRQHTKIFTRLAGNEAPRWTTIAMADPAGFTSNQAVFRFVLDARVTYSVDSAFGDWKDESLEIAAATFEAAAEHWPK